MKTVLLASVLATDNCRENNFRDENQNGMERDIAITQWGQNN